MLKTTDKNHYFLERSCEVLSPESTQGRTSTQSQEDGHSLCCSLGYHMGLALGGLKDSFIWHLKDVEALSRLGQGFSILQRMALKVTNDLF